MTLIASVSKDIQATPQAVWDVVTDIEHCASVITGIKNIEILEPGAEPDRVGLKWKETREWMGREAVEVMWITDASAPSFYQTRAENRGSVYQSRLALEPTSSGTRLSMEFDCEPQTFSAKLVWMMTGWMAKKPIGKMIDKDLEDIKAAVEKS